MGLLWRVFAPKPLKKARRTVRKATHPVHTAVRAATPKPVKRLERAAHPLSLAELKAEDAVVNAVRGGRAQRPTARRTAQAANSSPATPRVRDHAPGQFTASWRDTKPVWMRDGMEAALVDGDEDLEVVGESFHQENLWRLAGRHRPEDRVRCDIRAVLVAEYDNPHDPNAVGVWINGLKVGHLSRYDARRYRPGLLALQGRRGTPIALPGVIAGGGIRKDGPGRLGVFLRHDPSDFDL